MNVRLLASAVALLTLIAVDTASATRQTHRKWCSSQDGAMNCVYRTLASCEKTTRGEGGECVPNPRMRR